MTGTTAWIRPLTQEPADIPTRREVAGSHCRTSRGLFDEWAERLGFPAHFGHNWDAFRDSLGDAVANTDLDPPDPHNPPPLTILLREAGDLLTDEPPQALRILLSTLNERTGDDPAAPKLLLLLDDTPDLLPRLAQRMVEAGYPPCAAPGPRH
ncbi:barstar family protein [Streptomyces caniscabiei]|uniref:barstar family protein n=1 Tax=Streptomyces caniscabiei TaxID=2746961 RepID=UPI0007660B33|nr:barstar family protein [Streptomyces caniscabiei]